MQRPASIVTFERCYLGAWIIGLVNTAINWNATMAQMNANPATAQLGASFGRTMLIGGTVIGAAITLLLWYFVARKGAVVAKWIVTVFFVLGLLAFLYSAAMGRMATGTTAVIAVVTLVLQGVAVAMLFKADAKAWFGEAAADPVA